MPCPACFTVDIVFLNAFNFLQAQISQIIAGATNPISCRRPHNEYQRNHLNILQAPIPIHYKRLISIPHRRPSQFITGANLDSLQVSISTHYRRPLQFPTSAIPIQTGAATIADKHQSNSTQTRSRFLSEALIIRAPYLQLAQNA